MSTQGVTLIGGYSGHQVDARQPVGAARRQQRSHGMHSQLGVDRRVPVRLSGWAVCLQDGDARGYLHRFGRWCDQRLYIVDHADVMSPDEAIQLIVDSKRMLGCDMFVLDCLMQIDLGGELENEKRFMAKLGAIARAYEIAIVVVHHMRKPQGPEGEKRVPGRESFIGSSHLVNAAAGVLILWQDAEKAGARHNGEEVDDDKPDFVLSVAKNRFMPFKGRSDFISTTRRACCVTAGRRFEPIVLEGTCRSTESAKVIELGGSMTKPTPASSPEIDLTTATDQFPLSNPLMP